MANSTTVGRVNYEIVVDSSGLIIGLKQAESSVAEHTSKGSKALTGFKNSAQASFNAMKTAAKVAMAAIGVSIGMAMDSAIKRVDTLNNFPKVMTNLGVSAEDASYVINDLSDKLRGLPTSLDTAANAVQRLTATTGDVKQAESIFLALNNAVLAGGQSMELQSTAVEQFSQSFAKGKMDVIEYRALMSAMPAQMKQLASVIGVPFENLQEALTNSTSEFYVGVEGLADAMVKMSSEGQNGFLSFEEQAKNSTGGIGTSIENAKTAVVRGAADMLEAIGSENIKLAAEGVGKALEGIGTAIANVITFFKENQWAWEALKVILIALTVVIVALTIAQIAFNIAAMMNPFTYLVLGVVALIAGIILLVANFQYVMDFFAMIGDWIYQNTIKPIGDFFAMLWNGIISGVEGVKNVISNVFGAIIGIVKTPINWIIQGINTFIGGLNALKIPDWVPGVGGLSMNIPLIPELATGGIVEATMGGQIIRAGEAGEDEWVVPESKMADMISQLGGGTGSPITINLSGVFATSQSDRRRVAQQIADELALLDRARMGAN